MPTVFPVDPIGNTCLYHHSAAEMLKIWISEAPNMVVPRERKPVKPITINNRDEEEKERPFSSK